MRRVFKALFYAVFALVWLVMIALGLEVWERLAWQRIEKANPFVRSRIDRTDWPQTAGPDVFSPELNDSAARENCRGAGQSKAPLPVPDAAHAALRRTALLPALEDWERYAFANTYGYKVLLVDGRGMVVKAYSEVNYPGGKKTSDFMGAADAAAVGAALSAAASGGPPALADHGENAPWYCIAACSNPGPAGPDSGAVPPYAVVCWPNSSLPPPDPNNLWDRDFFSYRPHEKRAAQRNVLGVSEQFETNNAGLRDDDVVLPKPDNVYRVLCVGASTTEEGPTNDLTYPNILECLANERFGQRRVDVINAGISGMNSLKHKLKLADYLALQPDLIVIYVAVNDICHDLFPLWIKHATPWQVRLRESRFVNNHFNAWLLPDEAQMIADIDRAKMSNFRFIIEQARAAGVEAVLCTFAAPDPAKLDRAGRQYMEYYTQREWGGRYVTFRSYLHVLDLFNRRTTALGAELGVPVIDVSGEISGGTEIFGDICHMKNRGIETKARVILKGLAPLVEDRLRQRGLMP